MPFRCIITPIIKLLINYEVDPVGLILDNMVVSVAAPPRAAATLQRNWVPLRESPTAYEVSRAASRALVRRQLAHPSSLAGASAWSKCALGSAPARLLCLLRARLVALLNSALPGRDRPTGRPATAPGARARRRCHRLRTRTARGGRARPPAERVTWTSWRLTASFCTACASREP